MDQAKIYLCKADSSMLGTLTGIQTQTCTLKRNATDLWELTFDVNRYIDADGSLVQSDYYDSVDEMMRLYLDSADIQAFFVIDSEPVIKGDGYQETKSVTAHSVECELCNLYLKNFKVNCGTPDSQEYLACETDQDQNTVYYNVNPYTKLPYEYISLVNYDDPQLSLLHLVLQGTGWTVKERMDRDMCQIKKRFESSDSIYSFLMKTVSPAASVIFEFDRKHKTVGMVKADKYGEDTGIFITMRNLMNSFEVTSTSNENIITKLIPTGANNLGIEQVNFGKDSILNLDYFMNTKNEYGDYKFVSEKLHDNYCKWKHFREEEPFSVSISPKENIQGTRREVYAELSKRYNQTLLDINELKNRVPNDGCIIDYTTYSQEELDLSLKAYRKALAMLITVYKNEYGVTELGTAPNYLPVPEDAVSIKETPYWYDFYAYEEIIIPKIEEALKHCTQSVNGEKKQIDSYLYEWSLYGLDELQAKKKAWSEAANLLFDKCFITSGTVNAPVEYRTADDDGWNGLTDDEQKAFTSKSAYIAQLNQYLDYMAFDDDRNNSITKTPCKGIIRKCDDEIAKRLAQVGESEAKKNAYDKHRKELANTVLLDTNFKIQQPDNTYMFFFDEEDMSVINGIIREQEFNNDNIIVTNLDDIVSTVDIQETLYQSAAAKLHELSQPQYSFHTELDNLYALDAFKAFQKPFDIGNFIRVGLETHEEISDNRFIKLRLISISHNPLQADENLSVEFSTMTKALNGINDLAFLLGNESGTSSGSSLGSVTSGGTYGNNDANVQISNNLLNALLCTETFGTAVNDVILDSIKANTGNFNTLISHSGIFDSLESGQIKVSGDCLFNRIKSLNYTEGKSGSMLNLTNGSFSFAAGALTYNPQDGLIIKGVASDDSLQSLINGLSNGTTSINGSCITTGLLKSENWNGSVTDPIGNTKGSIICLSDGRFNFGGGNLKYDGTNLLINGNGKFTGEIIGTSGTFNGNITATTLTANQSGSIAGWTFDSNGFHKNGSKIAIENGMYLGNDGISVSDFFVVKKEGMYLKSKDWTSAIYDSSIGEDKTGRLFTLSPNQYIKVYLYNMKNIDFFELSWNYDFKYTDGDVNKNSSNNYCIRGWGIGRTEETEAYYYDGDNIVIFTLPFDFICNKIDPNKAITSITFNRFYSMGRTINNKYFESIQIGKIEVFSPDNTLTNIVYGTRVNAPSGIMINTFTKHIYTSNFSINNNELKHMAVHNSISSNSPNVYIDSDGRFMRSSSSSSRYKKEISSSIPFDISPEKLYDIDIVSYKYNDNYIPSNDKRYEKDIIGFIVEDIYKKYPIACNLDKDGNPEMWNINILFPALTKLVQEQHTEIELIKKQLQQLKEDKTNGDN